MHPTATSAPTTLPLATMHQGRGAVPHVEGTRRRPRILAKSPSLARCNHRSNGALCRMVSMTSIRRYCDAIAREFRPQRIVLFGSHACGKPHRDSDVDVLVIMKRRRGLGRRPSIAIRQRIPATFPVDVIVRDPQDFARRIAQGDSFLREIEEKGRTMYEATDA